MSEMTEHTGLKSPAPGAGQPRRSEPSAQRAADRRQQLRWVPLTAGLMALVLGLGYVAEGLVPGLYHRRLEGLSDLAPGTLVSLTRTADVIIGLTLLMLSHGLRRRKRRAWAAVMALLAFGVIWHAGLQIVIHTLRPTVPLGQLHPIAALFSAVLLVVLYCYRDRRPPVPVARALPGLRLARR
jgi:lysylphosphatidylglycerol synthetase-like protein (DUF2156 family)